jgi:hypothetical protein
MINKYIFLFIYYIKAYFYIYLTLIINLIKEHIYVTIKTRQFMLLFLQD